MKKFRKPYLKTVYLEVEVSDEELKSMREEILEDEDAEDYTEEDINDAMEEYLDDVLWDKFYDAKKQYEVDNKETLVDTDDWDIEEV